MRKIVILAPIVVLGLAACGSSGNYSGEIDATGQPTAQGTCGASSVGKITNGLYCVKTAAGYAWSADSGTSSAPPPTVTHAPVTQAPATHAPVTQAPVAQAPPPPATQVPQYTVSEQQAISAAESYLSEGTGFSYAGLVQQLDSPDGNGFSQADATFAVNHVSVDWNQQAVDAANSYLSEGTGFSYDGLVQQLDSPAGDGFTEAQAVYAVTHVSVNWDQQAVDAAKGYMSDGSGFSCDGLVQQLDSPDGDGFTEAQAQYAAQQVGLC